MHFRDGSDRRGNAGLPQDQSWTACSAGPVHAASSAARTAPRPGFRSAAAAAPRVSPASLRPADQPMRASESISVLRRMPNVRQTVALLTPPSSAAITALSFSTSIATGRPPRRPRRRARSAEPVEFPDYQTVAGLDERERFGQADAIIAVAACTIFEQMSLIDPCFEQCITLQVQHLSVSVGSDPHVNETPVPPGFRSQAVPDLSAYAYQEALSLLPANLDHSPPPHSALITCSSVSLRRRFAEPAEVCRPA